jgi:hypothetical protein
MTGGCWTLAGYHYRTGGAIACNDYERVLCRIKARSEGDQWFESGSLQRGVRCGSRRLIR